MDERKTKKIMLELDEQTFAKLELLAFGLHLEDEELTPLKHDKKKDDFAPMVKDLLVGIADSLADGVMRSGAWEHDVVRSLTGWQGTYNPGMAAECIKDEINHRIEMEKMIKSKSV